jgi:NOL1/NOP2/fmu family ribosome biogenesis protein
MILVGFNKVAFYDTNGLKWVTKVSHDGIKITKINRENIIGFAWDPSKDQNVEFEIDVETGVSKGGSGL